MNTSDTEYKKMSKNQQFGVRLKEQRKAMGFTQQELAELIGRSIEAVSKMERGITFPSVELLIDIAQQLNTSVDFLLGTDHKAGGSKERVQLTSEAIRIINELEDKPLRAAVEQLRVLRDLMAS